MQDMLSLLEAFVCVCVEKPICSGLVRTVLEGLREQGNFICDRLSLSEQVQGIFSRNKLGASK